MNIRWQKSTQLDPPVENPCDSAGAFCVHEMTMMMMIIVLVTISRGRQRNSPNRTPSTRHSASAALAVLLLLRLLYYTHTKHSQDYSTVVPYTVVRTTGQLYSLPNHPNWLKIELDMGDCISNISHQAKIQNVLNVNDSHFGLNYCHFWDTYQLAFHSQSFYHMLNANIYQHQI